MFFSKTEKETLTLKFLNKFHGKSQLNQQLVIQGSKLFNLISEQRGGWV